MVGTCVVDGPGAVVGDDVVAVDVLDVNELDAEVVVVVVVGIEVDVDVEEVVVVPAVVTGGAVVGGSVTWIEKVTSVDIDGDPLSLTRIVTV